jgi:23S rRNA (guanine2445-N2)-methyltransferase / 23S rRNA (guanine2069-N7)-methyltransferase
MEFFATAARGTAEVLQRELATIGVDKPTARPGGVAFGSTLEHGYRACMWSRIASRVLLRLTDFEAADADALYAGVGAVDWVEHLGPRETLAVATTGRDAPAGPPHFLALKTKDAIVDRVRAALGARPSIDTASPDVRIVLHIEGVHAILYLDLAGRGLHRRGGGRSPTTAPLRENLAAALLALAGWPERAATDPLFDPMCGSGTLLVEAAAIALDSAPGLQRPRFGAEQWRGHDAALWSGLRREARQRRAATRTAALRIAGADASSEVVAAARQNIERHGLASRITIERRAVERVAPPWPEPGVLIVNPPYGERLGEEHELGSLYEGLGDALRRRFPGWDAWVLSGNRRLDKRIGLRAATRHAVFNGPIECRLLHYPISSQKPQRADGPAWRQPGPEAGGFARRLAKNLKQRRRWAAREGLTCYRVYDSDIPEFNLSVDWYDGRVAVEEHAAPKKVPAARAAQHVRDALAVIPQVCGIEPRRVVLRDRRAGRSNAGSRIGDPERLHEVREGDLRFLVDPGATAPHAGLDLEARLLRRRLLEAAAGRRFLDLFARSGTAAAAAATGGARSTTSVDPSEAWLTWARANLRLNAPPGAGHQFVRSEPLDFLDRLPKPVRFDLLLVAPPTAGRPIAPLLRRLADRTNIGGEVIVVGERREPEPDLGLAKGFDVEEITAAITPPDFERRPRLRAWSLRRIGTRRPVVN